MKLYVGTYAKYNRGSIAGAWVDLDKFANKAEFLKECRRLHRGERDPEFMFQDFEADHDWERHFYNESYIDEEYWTVAAEERAKAAKESAKPSKLNPIRQEFAAALLRECAAWNMTKEEAEKHAKAAEVVVKLTGGQFVAFDRLSIETRHCEGEDDGRGRSMKEAREACDFFKTEKGFKAINLARVSDFRRDRDELCLSPAYCGLTCFDSSVLKVYNIQRGYYAYDPRYNVAITPEDWKRIDKAVEIARERFAARLDAYWKRWGASKLYTWIYWTEA